MFGRKLGDDEGDAEGARDAGIVPCAIAADRDATPTQKPYAAAAEAAGLPDPHAPVAMFGDANHPAPRYLSKYFADRGVPVTVASLETAPPIGDGVTIVHPRDYEGQLYRRLKRRMFRALHGVERAGQHYSRWRGKRDDNPNTWAPFVARSLVNVRPLVRSATTQQPLFTFGHEVSQYGLAAVSCRGVPRFVFPWGGDVFFYADASPFLMRMTKYILRSADLVLPGSVTAARYIAERYGVEPDRVIGHSWGIDLTTFLAVSRDVQQSIRARWGIPPGRVVILNSRRFRREWGAFTALEAFLQIATERSETHFVMLGGEATESDMNIAREEIAARGMTDRFTLVAGEATMETCTELMQAADVYTSLLGEGDMRSWSVLQATACGGVPVIADGPEHREMTRFGFRAALVPPDDARAVAGALRRFIDDPEERAAVRAANDDYMRRHEDETVQMDLFWDLLMRGCRRFWDEKS